MRISKIAPSSSWFSTSWQSKPVAQPITYEDEEHLSAVTSRLAELPELVPAHEIDQLSQLMTHAARGEVFVIQGGDCAEAFRDAQPEIVTCKRRLMVDQAQCLAEGLGLPVVGIGRIAGQYSKPRSSCFETLSCGSVVHAFRGDNINAVENTGRLPDPERLCMGYHFAAVIMSILRGASKGENEIAGLTPPSSGVYTSHEALNLPLETAMTHYGYNTSAHMLWIGDRTRSLDGAHVEYMRGLRNPIGIKIGPNASPSELVELLSTINPQKAVGKVAIITRLGSHNVEDKLPSLLKAVQDSDHLPVWLCDPCHGNTVTTPSKVKTRIVGEMVAEVKASHMVHLEHGSKLAGIHIEQTGEDVTECVDCDRTSLDEAEFLEYRTLCDPRLSGKQAMSFIDSYVDFVRGLAVRERTSHRAKGQAYLSRDLGEQRHHREATIHEANDGVNVLAREGHGPVLQVQA